jgi:tetratricopeptide (TPR) repeat protein
MTGKSNVEGSAEAAFEQGVAAFLCGDASAAHVAFERAHRREPRDPRYMSWYGLTLVLVERNSNLGVSLCDQALRGAGADPDLLLNQARVHLALNQRERAVRALQRGLELWPDHPALLRARDSLGWRRRPVLPFLHRNNPVNRWLGQLRHRFARRLAPGAGATPLTLGVILPLRNAVTPAATPPPAPTDTATPPAAP